MSDIELQRQLESLASELGAINLPRTIISRYRDFSKIYEEAFLAKINLKTMSVDALFKLRGDVDSQLASRRSDLEKQIALMGGDRIESAKPGRKAGSKLAGRKIAPKFRSKKDPRLQWAGRGATPRWMREEMKASKLKKEAFAIK